jgi:hypothetical protein
MMADGSTEASSSIAPRACTATMRTLRARRGSSATHTACVPRARGRRARPHPERRPDATRRTFAARVHAAAREHAGRARGGAARRGGWRGRATAGDTAR